MLISRDALRPLIEARHTTPPTIVFANTAYREIADNWIRAVSRLEIENFWFVALDQNIHDHLTKIGVQAVLVECAPGLKTLWKLRIQLFRVLVDSGIDFIHSDADAVWLRDPIARYYTEQKDLDLIASQGTIWPPDVFTQWNFVLCCGFFVLRANERTEIFLRKLEVDVEITGDDQVSVNRLILQHDVTWNIESPYPLQFQNAKILLSRKMIVGEGDGLRIGVIPFAEVPRLHLRNNDPYIEHPLGPTDKDEKKAFFKEIGLWI